MKYLVDTNIFLEILLEQDKSKETQEALSMIDVNDFYVTDFSLHSIGVRLFREGFFNKYQSLISELIDQAGFIVVSLYNEDTVNLIHSAKTFRLDFDDAYQYCASKKHNLVLLSFDSDFDRTDIIRKYPADII